MTLLSACCVVWLPCFWAVTSHGAYLPGTLCLHKSLQFYEGSDIHPENCNKIFNKVSMLHRDLNDDLLTSKDLMLHLNESVHLY